LCSVSYYLVVVTTAAGGANPPLVGLCAGLGVIIGDTTALVGHGARRVSGKASDALVLLHRWVADTHSTKFYAFLFVYGAVMPLPNDDHGAAGPSVPHWRVILPFGAGNIVFNTAVALLPRSLPDHPLAHGVGNDFRGVAQIELRTRLARWVSTVDRPSSATRPLPVRPALGQELQHFAFTRRQQGNESVRPRPAGGARSPHRTAATAALKNGFPAITVRKRE
jgi:hypothetical protein